METLTAVRGPRHARRSLTSASADGRSVSEQQVEPSRDRRWELKWQLDVSVTRPPRRDPHAQGRHGAPRRGWAPGVITIAVVGLLANVEDVIALIERLIELLGPG